MKKLILFLFLFFSLQNLQSQKKELRFIPPVSVTDTSLKGNHSNFECRVYQLTNQNKQTSIMIVLVETGNTGNGARTKLRTNYLFKREKIYLKNVFFADVEVLDHYASVVDVPSLMQKLKEKYYQPLMWSVLHADVFFNTAHQRSGSSFALHH